VGGGGGGGGGWVEQVHVRWLANLVVEAAYKCCSHLLFETIKRTTIMCSVEDVSKVNVLRAANPSKATVTLRFGKYMN
jgi:hypothetical protein